VTQNANILLFVIAGIHVLQPLIRSRVDWAAGQLMHFWARGYLRSRKRSRAKSPCPGTDRSPVCHRRTAS